MSGTHTPSEYHSTGRGGFGNIGEGEGTYVDPEIIREGVVGESRAQDYSAGRGGAGNMVHPPAAPGSVQTSHDVVPETAMRPSAAANHENYHVGRGGVGNAHVDGSPGLAQGGHPHHLNGLHHHPHHHQEPAGGKKDGAVAAQAESENAPAPSFLDKAKHALHLDRQ